jgi:hypothetical protein
MFGDPFIASIVPPIIGIVETAFIMEDNIVWGAVF